MTPEQQDQVIRRMADAIERLTDMVERHERILIGDADAGAIGLVKQVAQNREDVEQFAPIGRILMRALSNPGVWLVALLFLNGQDMSLIDLLGGLFK